MRLAFDLNSLMRSLPLQFVGATIETGVKVAGELFAIFAMILFWPLTLLAWVLKTKEGEPAEAKLKLDATLLGAFSKKKKTIGKKSQPPQKMIEAQPRPSPPLFPPNLPNCRQGVH